MGEGRWVVALAFVLGLLHGGTVYFAVEFVGWMAGR